MGKRIISQARGHGSFTYRVRRKAYKHRIGYSALSNNGKAIVLKLINSSGHSAPLSKILINKDIFYIPACQGLYEGKEIQMGKINEGVEVDNGDILALKEFKVGDTVFNMEQKPGDGGKIVRTSGGFSTILRKDSKDVILLMSNKKEIRLNGDCRATKGIIAGQGRMIKPVVKAGKKHYMMKSRNKLWPRTSAVKMYAVDHPFGGGRGKRIKSKIAKRWAPAGAKVGHILPRRTGRKN